MLNRAKIFALVGAMKLAICNDIGEASYERSTAAAAMCDLIIKLNNHERGYVDMKRIRERCVRVDMSRGKTATCRIQLLVPSSSSCTISCLIQYNVI